MEVYNLYEPWKATCYDDLKFIEEADALVENSILPRLFKPLDSISICADEIFEKLKNIIHNIFNELVSGDSLPNPSSSLMKMMSDASNQIYSGWQFVSLEDRIEKFGEGVELLPFMKDISGELKYHKIFLHINKNEKENAKVYQRKMDVEEIAEGALTVDFSRDDIVIGINAGFLFNCSDILGEDGSVNDYLIIAAIAHELQHITEMYAFRNNNLQNSKGYSLFNDVKKNIFGIKDENWFRNICMFAYGLSVVEIRARYTQLRKFLTMVGNKCPDGMLLQLKERFEYFRSLYKNMEDGYSKAKTMSLFVNENVNNITHMKVLGDTFKKSPKDIYGRAGKTYCILGYHLCISKVLKDKDLCEYFTYENVKDIVDDVYEVDAKMAVRIFKYLYDDIYSVYYKNVYNICAEYSSKIVMEEINESCEPILRFRTYRDIFYDVCCY